VASASFGGEDSGRGSFENVQRLGVAAGISSRILIREWIAIQPEVFWVMKGSETEISDVSGPRFDASYVEIATLASLGVPMEGPIRPRLLAGPTLGILTRFELVYSDGSTEDRTERAGRLDLGLTAGAGATWNVSERWRLSLDARYDWGLTTIDATNETDLRNRAFFVLLGAGREL
jgi:opacity protein-like surface antigen